MSVCQLPQQQPQLLNSQQELRHCISQFEHYKLRTKPSLNLSELSVSNPLDFIDHINKEYKSQSAFTDLIIDKAIDMFHLSLQLIKQVAELTDSLNQCRNENKELKTDLLHSKQELKQSYMEKCQLQRQVMSQHHKIQELTSAFNAERKQMRDNYQAEVANKQQHQQLIEQLRSLNQQAMISLMSEQGKTRQYTDQNKQLQNRLQNCQRTVSELTDQIAKLKEKLQWKDKRKSMLQQQISSKDIEIRQLSQELQMVSQTYKNPFASPIDMQVVRKSSQKVGEQVRLSEDVQYNLPEQFKSEYLNNAIDEKSRNSSITQLSLNRSCTVSKIGSRDRVPIDPYFCHFVLLTQSIKIQQNKEQYLSVDMKPHYRSLLAAKIPMFQWHKWIKSKLESLANQSTEDQCSH